MNDVPDDDVKPWLKVGMRVGYNEAARQTKGIISGIGRTPSSVATITEVGHHNHVGGHLVRLRWDDEAYDTFISPAWIDALTDDIEKPDQLGR